jgi:hypothetical protein
MKWAYQFECDQPILAILATLNRVGPWSWIERDKEAFGTYISATPLEGVRVRVYSDPQSPGENGPRYSADFVLEPRCRVSRIAIDATFQGILAALSARNVSPGEYWD